MMSHLRGLCVLCGEIVSCHRGHKEHEEARGQLALQHRRSSADFGANKNMNRPGSRLHLTSSLCSTFSPAAGRGLRSVGVERRAALAEMAGVGWCGPWLCGHAAGRAIGRTVVDVSDARIRKAPHGAKI